MTYIKFCGMTREEDVETAVELGIDAVGFVLWPGSPRCVPRGRLAALVRTIPADIRPVAVLVRPTEDDISFAADSGVRALQVYDAGAQELVTSTIPVWIGARLAGDGIAPPVPGGSTIVLDAHDAKRYGGTGRTIDWQRAARVAATRRLLLAGGLTAANVARAIRQVRPFGVDVASGIEERPGVKSADKMCAFVNAVRKASR
jgi:phosphoribosylanthranilate isomerase